MTCLHVDGCTCGCSWPAPPAAPWPASAASAVSATAHHLCMPPPPLPLPCRMSSSAPSGSCGRRSGSPTRSSCRRCVSSRHAQGRAHATTIARCLQPQPQPPVRPAWHACRLPILPEIISTCLPCHGMPPLLQGALGDPLYFDFICFSQFAAASRALSEGKQVGGARVGGMQGGGPMVMATCQVISAGNLPGLSSSHMHSPASCCCCCC
jgi:hypothetical protein